MHVTYFIESLCVTESSVHYLWLTSTLTENRDQLADRAPHPPEDPLQERDQQGCVLSPVRRDPHHQRPEGQYHQSLEVQDGEHQSLFSLPIHEYLKLFRIFYLSNQQYCNTGTVTFVCFFWHGNLSNTMIDKILCTVILTLSI